MIPRFTESKAEVLPRNMLPAQRPHSSWARDDQTELAWSRWQVGTSVG